MTTVAIIGLGEAGALYARGLRESGLDVRGFDQFARLDEPGVKQCDSIASTVERAELVISLVGARPAEAVLREALPSMLPGAVFGDFNTSSPSVKREMASLAAGGDILFADVAVLAPVPRSGSQTPLIVSGAGKDRLVELLKDTGAPVEPIGEEAGEAAIRKLLRSVFMKGLAAVVVESTTAADKTGQGEWLRSQITDELGNGSAQLIERLVTGTKVHAARRAHEITDAANYLDSLGTPSWMSLAAKRWLTELQGSTTPIES